MRPNFLPFGDQFSLVGDVSSASFGGKAFPLFGSLRFYLFFFAATAIPSLSFLTPFPIWGRCRFVATAIFVLSFRLVDGFTLFVGLCPLR